MSYPYTLYRLYDADNVLLYVGFTSSFQTRIRAHKRSPIYGHRIAYWTTQRWFNEQDGARAERRAIRHEAPLLNIASQPTAARQDRARLERGMTVAS